MAQSANQSFMQQFSDLASMDATERLRAASTLIQRLHLSQTAFTATPEADATSKVCPDILYTMKRLVRGLSSSRQAARQGFATALTELLSSFPVVTPRAIYDLIVEQMEVTGAMKGPEQRDVYFGRLFAFATLIASQRLEEPEALEVIPHVIEDVVRLGQSKSYLRIVACDLLAGFTNALSQGVFEKHALPALRPYLTTTPLTPEAITVLLACEPRLKTTAPDLYASFKHKTVMHAENFEALAEILADSVDNEIHLHAVWGHIFARLAQLDTPVVQAFWTTVVDNVFFSEKRGTMDRRTTGLKLLQSVLSHLKGEKMIVVFTPNLLKCFIGHVGSSNSLLYPPAQSALKAMSAAVATLAGDDRTALGLLAALTGPHGSRRFDAITKSKTVEGILGQLTIKGVHEYIAHLRAAFLQAGKDVVAMDTHEDRAASAHGEAAENEVSSRMMWAADQMLALVRNPAVPRDEQWPLDTARFLFVHAFWALPSKDSKAPKDVAAFLQVPSGTVTDALRKYCATRFYGVLHELATAPPVPADKKEDGKPEAGTHGKDGVAADGELRVMKLLSFAKQLHALPALKLAAPLSPEAEEAFGKLTAAVEKIQKAAAKKKGAAAAEKTGETTAFEVLFVQMTLQLYADSGEILGVVDDLLRSYEEFTKAAAKPKAADKKASKKKAAEAEEDGEEAEEDERDSSEILMDILLSLLSKPSSLLRGLVDQVFPVFSEKLTHAALDLMFEVLEKSNDMEVASDEEEDVSEEEEEVEEDNLSEEENEEESEEEDGEVDEALRKKLKESMGLDSDAEGSTDSEWDDEKMETVDEVISKHFREQKASGQKQAKEEKRDVVHFKLRVLDLIEIYAKKQASNPLVLELFLPLLSAYRVALSDKEVARPLVERLQGLYKNRLCALREYPRPPLLDVNRAHIILEDLLDAAQMSNSTQLGELAGNASLFFLRVLISGETKATAPAAAPAAEPPSAKKKSKKGKEAEVAAEPAAPATFGCLNVDKVKTLLRKPLQDFLTKRSSVVRPALITDICNRFPVVGWMLVPMMFEYFEGAVNDFRRLQVLTWLGALLQQKATLGAHADALAASVPAVSKAAVYLLTREEGPADAEAKDAKDAKGGKAKIKNLRTLANFLNNYVRAVKTHAAGAVKESAALQGALLHVLKSEESQRSGPLRAMCAQVLRELGGHVPEDLLAKKDKKDKGEKRKARAQDEEQGSEDEKEEEEQQQGEDAASGSEDEEGEGSEDEEEEVEGSGDEAKANGEEPKKKKKAHRSRRGGKSAKASDEKRRKEKDAKAKEEKKKSKEEKKLAKAVAAMATASSEPTAAAAAAAPEPMEEDKKKKKEKKEKKEKKTKESSE